MFILRRRQPKRQTQSSALFVLTSGRNGRHLEGVADVVGEVCVGDKRKKARERTFILLRRINSYEYYSCE